MNKLLKTVVLLAQIGGGLVGLSLIGRAFLTEHPTKITMIIHGAFILVFSFGIVAGMVLIKRPRLGRLLSAIFQAMQIPIIVGPTIAYALFSGASFNVYKHATGWGFNFLFGSRYSFYLNGGQPSVLGINLLAVVLFILLVRESWRHAATARLGESQSGPLRSAGRFSQVHAHQVDSSPLRHSSLP